MKSAVKKPTVGHVLALALTWDGSRWPTKSLPPQARAFLGKSSKAPRVEKLSVLLSRDQVDELRVCWVPRLKGGDDVLTTPFQTTTGLRMAFHPAQAFHFGDVLGVIYRRL